MLWSIAADLVLMAHLLFVMAAVLGGLAWRWWRLAPLVHLPMAFWGASVELIGGACPLTTLENRLLQAAGEAGYGDSFVGHYLLAALYPEGLDRETQVWLGMGVVAANGLIYAWVGRRRRHARARARARSS